MKTMTGHPRTVAPGPRAGTRVVVSSAAVPGAPNPKHIRSAVRDNDPRGLRFDGLGFRVARELAP